MDRLPGQSASDLRARKVARYCSERVLHSQIYPNASGSHPAVPFARRLHLSGGAKSRSHVGRARPRLPPLNNDNNDDNRLLSHRGLQQVRGTRRGVGLRLLSEDTGSLEVLPAPVDRCPAVVMRTSAGRHLASEPKTNRPETNCTQRAEHPAGSALPQSYFSVFFFGFFWILLLFAAAQHGKPAGPAALQTPPAAPATCLERPE